MISLVVLVRDTMHHIAEHLLAAACAGHQLIHQAGDGVRHLGYHPGDPLLEFVAEHRHTHQPVIRKVEMVPEMCAVLVVGCRAVQRPIGLARFRQFHRHAHVNEIGGKQPRIALDELALVGLHTRVQFLQLPADTRLGERVAVGLLLRTEAVAISLALIEETDVIEEHLVLPGLLHHQPAEQVLLAGGQHHLGLVEDHLEELGAGSDHGVDTRLVSACGVEHGAPLGIGHGGVGVIELVAVVVGQVKRVLATAGDGHIEHPAGSVAVLFCLCCGGHHDGAKDNGQDGSAGHGGEIRITGTAPCARTVPESDDRLLAKVRPALR